MQLFQLAGLVQKPLNAKLETALAEALKKATKAKLDKLGIEHFVAPMPTKNKPN